MLVTGIFGVQTAIRQVSHFGHQFTAHRALGGVRKICTALTCRASGSGFGSGSNAFAKRALPSRPGQLEAPNSLSKHAYQKVSRAHFSSLDLKVIPESSPLYPSKEDLSNWGYPGYNLDILQRILVDNLQGPGVRSIAIVGPGQRNIVFDAQDVLARGLNQNLFKLLTGPVPKFVLQRSPVLSEFRTAFDPLSSRFSLFARPDNHVPSLSVFDLTDPSKLVESTFSFGYEAEYENLTSPDNPIQPKGPHGYISEAVNVDRCEERHEFVENPTRMYYLPNPEFTVRQGVFDVTVEDKLPDPYDVVVATRMVESAFSDFSTPKLIESNFDAFLALLRSVSPNGGKLYVDELTVMSFMPSLGLEKCSDEFPDVLARYMQQCSGNTENAVALTTKHVRYDELQSQIMPPEGLLKEFQGLKERLHAQGLPCNLDVFGCKTGADFVEFERTS